MLWHILQNGGESRSACGRWLIYAIPEGFVVRDKRKHKLDFTDPFATLELAQQWAESQSQVKEAA